MPSLISHSQAIGPFFVGCDVGGTNVKVGIVDDLGQSLSFLSVPTEVPHGPERGATTIAQAILTAIEQADLTSNDIARVGLGTPGTMDIPKGMLLEPPNMQGWWDFPIVERVGQHISLPITFANDACAAAYGEYWIGCGRGQDSIVMLTLGTGIGGGIIVDDFSIDGKNSHGAELGHTIINYHDDARMCGCGQTGHLEAYASATALIQRAAEALAAGRPSSLNKRRESGETITPIIIGQEADAGDTLALELVLDTAKFIGVGIVTFVHTIDPGCVVIGGAMTFGRDETPLGRRFIEQIRQEVQRRAFPTPGATPIVYATLGGDAGYIGVAGLARVAHRRQAHQH
ncbi:MAG TPA: ROK family protein [Pirellulales bacterium]|jgi:glucokinase|nr:ROK family protein [Pirellulales bacterium]